MIDNRVLAGTLLNYFAEKTEGDAGTVGSLGERDTGGDANGTPLEAGSSPRGLKVVVALSLLLLATGRT